MRNLNDWEWLQLDEDPPAGSINAGDVFDDIVHRRMSPNAALDAAREGEDWEVAAMPRSATPLPDLTSGSLIVQRALGEQRLGSMRVLGQDIDARDLYGADGLIRPDILVLKPRISPAQGSCSASPDTAPAQTCTCTSTCGR